MEETNHVIFIHVPRSNARSISPMSSTPSDGVRDKNLGFFHELSRRFCRRSQEFLNGEEDTCSSSTDSSYNSSKCQSAVVVTVTRHNMNGSTTEISGESSDSSSGTSDGSTGTGQTNIESKRNPNRRSSSIRRAFQSLSISSRSLSCTNTPIKTKSESNQLKKSNSKSKTPPQRILRQPIKYTYLKGISGLPTQRVPRSSLCCNYGHR